ncbi:MAG: hypothetical protein JXA42_01310 [Anaerolineales bacterium]|nr:hypothetical protein [Anaerolineales bacterium]
MSDSSLIVALSLSSLLGLTGFIACILGLRTMLAQDYQKTLRKLSVQSAQIGQKGLLSDVAIAPMLEAASKLIEAVNNLVRTAVGIGVFLCLVGIGMMVAAYFMVSNLII